MQVYGFDYSNIFFLLSVNAVSPYDTTQNPPGVNINANNPYIFNPSSPNFGNPYLPTTIANAQINTNFPNWISPVNNSLDLRGFYLLSLPSNDCIAGGWRNALFCQGLKWPSPDNVLGTWSDHSSWYVGYTPESIFYAQSGYFVTIVMVQWSNVFACKSRKVPSPLFRFLWPTLPSINTCLEVWRWRLVSSFSSCTCRVWTECLAEGILFVI